MIKIIELSLFDVGLSAIFVLIAILISLLLKLNLVRTLTIAMLRTSIQLGLAALLLGVVFKMNSASSVLLLVGVMILLASREAVVRQKFKPRFLFIGTLVAMGVSALMIGIMVVALILRASPWWQPSFFIPLTGMILGNSLNGISLALDRFLQSCDDQRPLIESRLLMGASPSEATIDFFRNAIRSGMMPIVNSMMIVGVISLPGMLTGHFLIAFSVPWD